MQNIFIVFGGLAIGILIAFPILLNTEDKETIKTSSNKNTKNLISLGLIQEINKKEGFVLFERNERSGAKYLLKVFFLNDFKVIENTIVENDRGQHYYTEFGEPKPGEAHLIKQGVPLKLSINNNGSRFDIKEIFYEKNVKKDPGN